MPCAGREYGVPRRSTRPVRQCRARSCPNASRAKLEERKSAKFTEKYSDYINLGVIEWRKAYAKHEKMGKKAILFVMTDDTRVSRNASSAGNQRMAGSKMA